LQRYFFVGFLGIVLGASFWIKQSSRERIPAEAPLISKAIAETPKAQEKPQAQLKSLSDFSAVEKNQIQAIEEILISKNDNDPRLDKSLKNLSEAIKDYIKTRYAQLSQELRNEKGTLVFLLGRNLNGKKDFEFMKQVIDEPACRSLGDCGSAGKKATSEEMHQESATAVTLAYPQLVAVYSLERTAQSQIRGSPNYFAAIQALERAKTSPLSIIVEKAEQALARLSS